MDNLTKKDLEALVKELQEQNNVLKQNYKELLDKRKTKEERESEIVQAKKRLSKAMSIKPNEIREYIVLKNVRLGNSKYRGQEGTYIPNNKQGVPNFFVANLIYKKHIKLMNCQAIVLLESDFIEPVKEIDIKALEEVKEKEAK